MKLYDLLAVLDHKANIMIVDFEQKGKKASSGVMKVGNINMERLRNIGDKDVYSLKWLEDKKCFVVCAGDKRDVKTKLAMWDVVDTRLKQLGLVENHTIVRVR